MTSTVLTGWAPLSDAGRAVVFVGSCLSGSMFAYWAARSTTALRAFGKSVLSGALQANISATALLYLAFGIDSALHLSPSPGKPADFGAFAVIMFVAGSIVGAGVGMAYAIVPTLVAHWRKTAAIANADRSMLASSFFLFAAAFVHASIVTDWAAWAPLTVVASALSAIAAARMALRARFLARVRAGREPRYRIEPADGRSVLYRVAEEDDRAWSYRENATPPPPPELIGVL